ncbi:MAG: MFS transporter [Nitrospiraceae bacterium]|nr:MAG: MFS transporter [Nitrospiraceae bacterium]
MIYRNFRLYWFGHIISITGTWMHTTAQGWLVLKLTDSPFYLGLVGFAASLPILLFTLIGGVVADRFHKRKILLTTQIIALLLAFLLGILVLMDKVSVWHVLVITFCIGTVSAFDIPSRQSFLIEMVGRESLLNAIALNSMAFHGSRVTGPAVAGIVIRHFGIAACFFLNALSFLAAIISLLKMRFNPEDTRKHSQIGVIEEFRQGIKYLFSEPKIYTIITMVGIISFFGFPYIYFLPVYARDILKTGATGLGILMGCAGAGAFTGALNLAVRGNFRRKGPFMAVSGIIFSLALLLFSFSTISWFSYPLLFLVGWGAISQIATANSMIQLTVPDNLRGRVMSAFTTTFLGMATLGNIIIGTLANYLGTQIAVGIGAGCCLLGTLFMIWKKGKSFKEYQGQGTDE